MVAGQVLLRMELLVMAVAVDIPLQPKTFPLKKAKDIPYLFQRAAAVMLMGMPVRLSIKVLQGEYMGTEGFIEELESMEPNRAQEERAVQVGVHEVLQGALMVRTVVVVTEAKGRAPLLGSLGNLLEHSTQVVEAAGGMG